MISLWSFDIPYATSAMSRFNTLTREAHLKAAMRTLAYLNKFPKERIIVDIEYLNHSRNIQ
jgi:hypothetical protein